MEICELKEVSRRFLKTGYAEQGQIEEIEKHYGITLCYLDAKPVVRLGLALYGRLKNDNEIELFYLEEVEYPEHKIAERVVATVPFDAVFDVVVYLDDRCKK